MNLFESEEEVDRRKKEEDTQKKRKKYQNVNYNSEKLTTIVLIKKKI